MRFLHLSSKMLSLLGHGGSWGVMGPMTVLTGQKAGDTLDRPPVHHRADTQAYTFTHTHLHLGQFIISYSPGYMSLDCWRNPEMKRSEKHQTKYTTYANWEINPDPSCCVAAAVPAATPNGDGGLFNYY